MLKTKAQNQIIVTGSPVPLDGVETSSMKNTTVDKVVRDAVRANMTIMHHKPQRDTFDHSCCYHT